jgi:hypothetical protein
MATGPVTAVIGMVVAPENTVTVPVSVAFEMVPMTTSANESPSMSAPPS